MQTQHQDSSSERYKDDFISSNDANHRPTSIKSKHQVVKLKINIKIQHPTAMKYSILLLLAAAATLAMGTPTAPRCGTCNPLSGQNSCDITTSCINTGSTFHCACRAGYKACANNWDVHTQFRLPMPNYEFLVFVPENTVCDLPCDNPTAAPSNLCKEVPLYQNCAV